jgi:hypothetical protein
MPYKDKRKQLEAMRRVNRSARQRRAENLRKELEELKNTNPLLYDEIRRWNYIARFLGVPPLNPTRKVQREKKRT